MNRQAHWETIYTTRNGTTVSWYRPHLDLSLALIEGLKLDAEATILDVGGGSSTLVDDLLARGYGHVTVLDIAAAALADAQARLGQAAEGVTWLQADITQADLPPAAIDVWHDRAVFHFLTDEAEQTRYADMVHHTVRVGGHVIIATFAPDGPTICSGLPVIRYAPDEVHAILGAAFSLIDQRRETHVTPGGAKQRFQYSVFRRES